MDLGFVYAVTNLLLLAVTFSTAQTPECSDGDVEFVGLSVSHAGIVRVCRGGVWGTICAERTIPWSEKNCQVVCRRAGYSGAVSPILQYTLPASARQSVSSDPIHYHSVQCDGTETDVTRCLHSIDTDNCSHIFDTAVTCRQTKPFAGDVRLLGDIHDGVGVVEYYDSFYGWTGVCTDSFNSAAATIVCRQLGYEGGIPYVDEGYSLSSSFRIALSCDLNTDFTLSDCDWSAGCRVTTKQAGSVQCTTSAADYSVRLVGSDDGRAGVVEVAFNGRWGTICEDAGWSVEDASVVCNQLGLDSDSSPTITSGSYPNYHSQSVKPSWLSTLTCSSTEPSLTDCSYASPIGYTDCSISGNSAELNCGAQEDGGGLSGGAIAGIVIGSLVGVGILGFLIHLKTERDKKRKATAAAEAVRGRNQQTAPTPTPAAVDIPMAQQSSLTITTISSVLDTAPEQPAGDLTSAAPPPYQAALSYPTAAPQQPPTYPEKPGAHPDFSAAYPPPNPSAPPLGQDYQGYSPPTLPYPTQSHYPAYPPPAIY